MADYLWDSFEHHIILDIYKRNRKLLGYEIVGHGVDNYFYASYEHALTNIIN